MSVVLKIFIAVARKPNLPSRGSLVYFFFYLPFKNTTLGEMHCFFLKKPYFFGSQLIQIFHSTIMWFPASVTF